MFFFVFVLFHTCQLMFVAFNCILQSNFPFKLRIMLYKIFFLDDFLVYNVLGRLFYTGRLNKCVYFPSILHALILSGNLLKSLVSFYPSVLMLFVLIIPFNFFFSSKSVLMLSAEKRVNRSFPNTSELEKINKKMIRFLLAMVNILHVT